ncbi:hypothetical protein [Aquipuribacter nitratireducens]|uniref:Uncharacterized protein n=1 Tax=Aquipuribacter nitratireducens TaxID=650104 RepID=A0ABW0GJK5_9MICO
MTGTVTAPQAPGRLGEAVEPAAMERYLAELRDWREHRRAELESLDAQALGTGDGPLGTAADVTADVTLSMTLWQAVAERHDELVRVWDGGRVGPVERTRLAGIVWGRRSAGGDVPGGGLVVSLPEACRLSDALAGQLRLRLSSVGATDVAIRLRELRAGLERVRDLTGTDDPAQVRALASLESRLADVTARAGRGADVGGLLPQLGSDLARAERDSIVAAAARRDDERDAARAVTLRAELLSRSRRAADLERRCVAAVRDAPRLAVPRVEQLGPVPSDARDVDTYLVRLETVAEALERVEAAYAAPLAELAALRDGLEAYGVKARATGVSERAEVRGLVAATRSLLDDVPVDLARARTAFAAYRTLVSGSPETAATWGGDR